MGEKFYFVHSQMDMDLCNERRKKNFSQEGALDDCNEFLWRQGVSSPQGFLISSVFRPIFERKTKALHGQVRVQSNAISAVFNPGLSIACDVFQLMDCMASYCKSCGLDGDSLVNLAQQVGKPVVDLRAVRFLDNVAEDAQRVLLKALEAAEEK
ncbi:interferon-inducible GTPase 5-like [Dermochelys coriacea]|uniref:interferon-inducible GTPase 5-like n=1 Tax=Dermochelys coriacea TaxID=27794 RepID=UPI001CA9BB30|nr:interferon-inducible GTPase 5-like [Dermochelys coriacea]